MMSKQDFVDVTNALLKDHEEFLERMDDYEATEVSLKQVKEAYEESKENQKGNWLRPLQGVFAFEISDREEDNE